MDNEMFALVLLTYIVLIGYIFYLQYLVRKYYKGGQVLSMVISDLIDGDVEIKRTSDGIKIEQRLNRKAQND
jgi:hypothetical protein